TRTSAQAHPAGPEADRLVQGDRTGESRASRRAALRKCNLVAQSAFVAQGTIQGGGGAGVDRAGIRTERADLFQGLQEPGAGDRTGDRYGGSHARIGQGAGVLSGDDLRGFLGGGAFGRRKPQGVTVFNPPTIPVPFPRAKTWVLVRSE